MARLVIRIIAIILLIYAILLIGGSVLIFVDMIHGEETTSLKYFLRYPFYLLLFIASIGILRLRKWGVVLLFCAIFYDVIYWFLPGIYQDAFRMFLNTNNNSEKFIISVFLFYKRLLMPTILTCFFLAPQVRREFQVAKEDAMIKGPFDN